MWSRLLKLKDNLDRVYTVLVMDEQQFEEPRRFLVRPIVWARYLLGVMLIMMVLIVIGIVLIPLISPGGGHLQQNARDNSRRITALQDSLESQRQYLTVLQYLVTGQVDSGRMPHIDSLIHETGGRVDEPNVLENLDELKKGGSDGENDEIDAEGIPSAMNPLNAAGPDPLFPGLPPVKGFLTRGYDVQTGHLAVDLAVPEGTPVRSVAEGYVVFSDWTKETGNVVMVQHNGGYLSVYKHNQKLLKRSGEHVGVREIIAVSGNSGEITTGPHVHFELWRDGVALDPYRFLMH